MARRRTRGAAGPAHVVGSRLSGRLARRIARSRATRSAIGGWVANIEPTFTAASGLTMYRCANAGLPCGAGCGCDRPPRIRSSSPLPRDAASSFSSACASPSGSPVSVGPRPVRPVLPAARDGELDDQRRDRREDDRRDQRQRVAALVVAAAEEHLELRHLREDADRAADGRRDRADERVAVLDVAHLVGEDADELALVHELEDAAASPRRRCAWGCGRSRTRSARAGRRSRGGASGGPALGQDGDDRVDARLLVGTERSGAVRAEGERVALPVDEAVEQHGEPSAKTMPVWPPTSPPTATSRPPRAAIRVQVLSVLRRFMHLECCRRGAARGRAGD